MNKRDSPKHLVPLTPKSNRQRSKPSWIKCWQNWWKKQNINFFMSSVLFTVLTLPLNMIHLWTKLKWKIQQVFLLPSRFCVLIWHLGESLYPTIPKNKTSEGLSLSKQSKLMLYYCEILSIKWTFSKSSYTFLFKCSGVWIAALLIVSFIDPN